MSEKIKVLNLKLSIWARTTLFLVAVSIVMSVFTISWNLEDYFADKGIKTFLAIESFIYLVNIVALFFCVFISGYIFRSRVILKSSRFIRFFEGSSYALAGFRLLSLVYLLLLALSEGLGNNNIVVFSVIMIVWLGHIYFVHMSFLAIANFAVDRTNHKFLHLQNCLHWLIALCCAQGIMNFFPTEGLWDNPDTFYGQLMLHLGDLLRLAIPICFLQALKCLPRRTNLMQ